jgi:hypothetical protein
MGEAKEVLVQFSQFSTGAKFAATGTPVGTVYKNGTADALTVTATIINGAGEVGLWQFVFTPTYAASFLPGDHISLRVTATVDAIDGAGVVFEDRIEGTPTFNGITSGAGGTAINIFLAATASAVNDYYVGNVVTIVAGTGAGQSRMITDYVGSNKSAIVNKPWVTAPDTTSVYRIVPNAAYLLADSGTLAAAGATSATLAASAPAVADTYIGATLYISGGTGIGQSRVIEAYSAGRVCTVRAWTTTPTSASRYVVIPVGYTVVSRIVDDAITAAAIAADAGTEIATAVWARTGLTAGGVATAGNMLRDCYAFCRGRYTITGSAVQYYDDDDATALQLLTGSATERTTA